VREQEFPFPRFAGSARGPFAITPHFAYSDRGPFAVTPRQAYSDRGPFAVTPHFAYSDRGPFAVTPHFAYSDRGPFAVTPRYAYSDRGPFAVMPRYAYSDRGPFAVTPSGGRGPEGGGFLGLPAKVRRVVLDALCGMSPQRATDIFYEDDDKVFVMREGVQYYLSPPASTVWKLLGKRTLGDIVEEAAKRLEAKDRDQLLLAICEFVLAANQRGLVILDPES